MYRIKSRIGYLINGKKTVLFQAPYIELYHNFVKANGMNIFWYDLEWIVILDSNLNYVNTLYPKDIFYMERLEYLSNYIPSGDEES
jgi:hypothetical protein